MVVNRLKFTNWIFYIKHDKRLLVLIKCIKQIPENLKNFLVIDKVLELIIYY